MIRCLEDILNLSYWHSGWRWLEHHPNISEFWSIISYWHLSEVHAQAWQSGLETAMKQWTPTPFKATNLHENQQKTTFSSWKQLRKLWSTNSRVLSLDWSFLQGWTCATVFLLAKVWIFQWFSWHCSSWYLATTSLRWAFYHSFPVSGIWTLVISKIFLQKSRCLWDGTQ